MKNDLRHAESWERELAKSYRSARDLAEAGLITEAEIPRYEPVLARYKFLLPRYYAGLVDAKDPRCPIRLQAIPHPDELASVPGYVADPLRDLAHRPAPRITHRFHGRALLHLTSACSMYCRFCFRKTLLNGLAPDLFSGALEEALAYLRAHEEIEEVILSGGDPLMLSDAALARAVESLAEVPNLARLRLHTRVPVTFPARVTDSVARTLAGSRLTPVLVAHFNHPRELTPTASEALARLRESGVILLNQSVLLRGVNDDARTLAELGRALARAGVLPYYLHHPDPAEGTSGFDVSTAEGLRIHEALRRMLSGYLVPRYVIDTVGEPYKKDVTPCASSGGRSHPN